MPHVLIAGTLHPSGHRILADAAGITTTSVETAVEADYLPHVGAADAILIRTQPLRADTVARADRLKIVSRHGVGYDAIDVAALSARGIALAVCGNVNATSVAEHAAMLILAASKRAVRGDAAVRHGPWEWRNQLQSRDIHGQNLLLVGYGRIGRRTAAMMQGFGMTVRAHDPPLSKAGWPADGIPPVPTLAAGLAWADVISFSLPPTATPLIGAAEFAAMKRGVVLVNTARGGILDECALVAALETGQVAAAGLDVFETEPLPAAHPLTRFDQVILSPHIAGLTDGGAERMAIASAENIVRFFAGTLDSSLVVNHEQLNAGFRT